MGQNITRPSLERNYKIIFLKNFFQGLLQKISAENEAEQRLAKETLSLAVSAMKDVYEKTNDIYKEKKILDLP